MVDRNNVLNELLPFFNADPRYYLLIIDSGFGKIDQLKKLNPLRVFNAGIAEQATVSIASGMAAEGLIPIIYSIASFLVFRALEQIRINIVLRDTNVKLIGNGSGDYFKFLDECHCCRDYDEKLMKLIGMPFYTGDQFKEWLDSPKGGYLKC